MKKNPTIIPQETENECKVEDKSVRTISEVTEMVKRAASNLQFWLHVV